MFMDTAGHTDIPEEAKMKDEFLAAHMESLNQAIQEKPMVLNPEVH